MVFLSLSLVGAMDIQKAIKKIGSLDLCTSRELGRHLCAQRDFAPGEMIAKEHVVILQAARGPLSPILIGLNGDLIASHVPFLDDLMGIEKEDMGDLSCISFLQRERVKKVINNGVSLGTSICISAIIGMASHSCSPNADYGVASSSLSLVALQPIKKGEIVSVRYGHCHEMPSRYGFTCGCGGSEPSESILKIIRTIPQDEKGHPLILDYPIEIRDLLFFP